jgi:hypothetical protein
MHGVAPCVPNLMQDRKKIPALTPMFDLYSVDIVNIQGPLWNVGRILPSIRWIEFCLCVFVMCGGGGGCGLRMSFLPV